MITYAENNAEWEEWQQDYLYGVLLILPPPEVSHPIGELRKLYDPLSSRISPPHISVSDPLAKPMTTAIRDEIREQLLSMKPFELHFDKINACRDYAGVSFIIEPQQSIDEVKQALHATSAFSKEPRGRRSIPAHMTIAEFLSIEESLELCKSIRSKVPSGSFMCHELSYLVPDEQFRFARVQTFSLGGA